jgi:hypothetical protein
MPPMKHRPINQEQEQQADDEENESNDDEDGMVLENTYDSFEVDDLIELVDKENGTALMGIVIKKYRRSQTLKLNVDGKGIIKNVDPRVVRHLTEQN